MNAHKAAAREAILRAGGLVRKRFGTRLADGVVAKGRNDFVTEVDTQSEAMIKETLAAAHPGIGFLAEESAESQTVDTFWVIDPLDGTTNFIHGYPSIAVSIALMERGEVMLGCVYDPLRDELYEAERGGGASLNGKPIAVSGAPSLADSLLGTGFPFSVNQHIDAYLAAFKELFLQCRDLRRAGAAALDLCHVAVGRLDGFWELYLKPWDMAAGALIVREAGGKVSDFFGTPEFLEAGHIVAGTPGVFEEIVRVTSRHFDAAAIAGLGFRMRR
jgi:myo-inositol-1(or 4)-monophosphatase